MLLAETGRKLRAILPTLVLALALFFFSYHMISGKKGLLSMIQLEQKLTVAKAELAEVDGRRMQLEKRVNLLYTTSLDPDLLDEQARRNLGRTAAGEIVYMTDSGANAR